MTAQNALQALELLKPVLRAQRWRLPILVQGQPAQCRAQVMALCRTLLLARDATLSDHGLTGDVLWVGRNAPPGAWVLPVGKANHELGREAGVVVVDLFDGLGVDTLAAVAGLVRAGGGLILLAPPLSGWHEFDDPEYRRITVEPLGVAGVRRHFLARMARLLAGDERVLQVDDDGAVLRLPKAALQEAPVTGAEPGMVLPGVLVAGTEPAAKVASDSSPDELGCISEQQRAVVDAVVQVATGHRNRPLVVQADRGRGKSAALGIAASLLLRAGKRILVTAPRPEAVECLLRFARSDANSSDPEDASSQPGSSLQFIAPDLLTQTLPDADLLLVDEAAAIAPALLQVWLQRYSRVVFATTVQGYEGTGRGFAIRFAQTLDRLTPQWKERELTRPVRWGEGDPLETLLDDLLLLSACVEVEWSASAAFNPVLEELTPRLGQLPETDLRDLFGLLVTAHYRTRPSDLRTLLDGPNLRTFVLRDAGTIVAVVLVADEGGLPADLAQAIADGKRRPHGHVLPQSLAVHLNVTEALQRRSWRIVRIAVHSQARRQGLGRVCLEQLLAQAQTENVALLGSLFAASADVLAFWQACGFTAVRVGITPEATSGAYPLLVSRAVNVPGALLLQQARRRFEQTFLPGLPDAHPQLPAALVLAACGQAQFPSPVMPDHDDGLDLQHYLAGHKTFENAAVALWKHLQWQLASGPLPENLDHTDTSLLVGKILQKQPWPALVKRTGLSGSKVARERLRQAVAKVLSPAMSNGAD